MEEKLMTETRWAKPESPPPPPPLAGLGVAAAVATAIVGWAAVSAVLLSQVSIFAGFMVLWYWAKVEHLSLARLPATILGALVGICLSWVMLLCAQAYGGPGFAFGFLLLFLAIYLDVIQVMPLLFNASTMLFLIVSAAPLIQLKINWVEFCLAAAGGGVFFGAFVAGVMWLPGKVSRRTS
jgi:hypothetical protein